MSKRFVAAAFVAASALLLACDDNPTGPSDRARLRAVNAAPATPSIDLFADVPPVPLIEDIAFNTTSECQQVPEGDLALEVRASGGSTALASVTQSMVAGTSYQDIFLPGQNITVISGDTTPPANGAARLHVINATETAVDVYATPPGDTTWAPAPTLDSVTTTTAVIPLTSNHLRLTPHTLERVLLDIPALDIPEERILTVVFTRSAAGVYGFTTAESCF